MRANMVGGGPDNLAETDPPHSKKVISIFVRSFSAVTPSEKSSQLTRIESPPYTSFPMSLR